MKHVLIALILTAGAATAEEFQPVTDREEFMALLGGRNLSNRLYGIKLAVGDDGTITGTGAGSDVSGAWQWADGYFCRELLWGDDPIAFNCQLVESRNGNEMRFSVDRGAGDSASFMLR